MNEKLKEQSLDVVAGDHPALNTLAVNPTPWNICPVCKNQADVDDDASDGSQIRCHECKADLVVVEFGNPDGNGSTWELRAADGREGAMQPKTSTSVDAPDIVERCAVAFWECEWPTRSHAKFADESEDTREGIKGGIRAALSELATMGGKALPSGWLMPTGDATGAAHVILDHVKPTLAAKDATIAEQAMEIERLAAKVGQLEGDRHDLRGMYRRALDGADVANKERNVALADLERGQQEVAHERGQTLIARGEATAAEAEARRLSIDLDSALAEVARLKAEAEAMRKRVRILEIAPKAAWWANDKLGCGVLITDADNAARVIAGVGANATDDWAKAVLEYAAREGLT